VVIRRGDVCWADLGEPSGSRTAKRRPVLVIQGDSYNASRLNTTLAVVITSSTGLAAMPGNVFVPATASGLPRDSVVNVTALVTLDKVDLDPAIARAMPAATLQR
jgi:mRNA interferase MazF